MIRTVEAISPINTGAIRELVRPAILDSKHTGRAQRQAREQMLGLLGAFRRYETHEPVRDDQRTGAKRWDIRRPGDWPVNLMDGVYNFVVRVNGELRIPLEPTVKNNMHHHELAGEEPVVVAGELNVRAGEIKSVSNKSGHYEPEQDSLFAAAVALVYWEVPIAPDAVLIAEPAS